MKSRTHNSLDRVLGRIESLDTVNLTNLVQRLARERALLEMVFNTIREGILVIRGDGLIEYANQASLRLIGMKENEVGQVSLWRLVPGLRQSLDWRDDEPTRHQATTAREFELTYPEPVVVRLYIVPIDTEEEQTGSPGHRYAVILSDISQEKITTREMIESEKISSIILLAGGVAHELGNPLNSLNIHLQLIRRQSRKLESSAAVDKIMNSVQVCQQEIERLDGIIQHFLEAIRPRPPDLQELNPLEVLGEVLEFQNHEITNRHLRIEVESPLDSPFILADRNQLKQAYFNIIKNAFEAMESEGILHVGIRSDDESLYLSFSDTGSGIDPQDLPRVFDPYFTKKKGGHGLGLMIVQRIMREHGGQIGIDSISGQGTRITLQFPLRQKKVRFLTQPT